MQKLNWSERASVGVPRNCSGAMYAGVPIIAPVRVRRASKAPELECPASAATGAEPGLLVTIVGASLGSSGTGATGESADAGCPAAGAADADPAGAAPVSKM